MVAPFYERWYNGPMKTCNQCNEDKELSEFYKDKKMVDGLRGNCKTCHIKQVTPNTHKQYNEYGYGRKDYVKPKERRPVVPEVTRVHPIEYRDSPMWVHRKRISRHGLTIPEYTSMYEAQGGRCAICNAHESELDRVLSIDHCHDTLKVRGLLCQPCNVGLGHFRDNPEYLKAAIEYLSE